MRYQLWKTHAVKFSFIKYNSFLLEISAQPSDNLDSIPNISSAIPTTETYTENFSLKEYNISSWGHLNVSEWTSRFPWQIFQYHVCVPSADNLHIQVSVCKITSFHLRPPVGLSIIFLNLYIDSIQSIWQRLPPSKFPIIPSHDIAEFICNTTPKTYKWYDVLGLHFLAGTSAALLRYHGTTCQLTGLLLPSEGWCNWTLLGIYIEFN